MSGASGEGSGVRLPRTWRPLGARMAGAVFGVLLIAAFTALWLGFDDATRATFSVFQRLTTVFMVGLGLAALFALVRSRAVAHERGLTVVNGYRRHEYEWAQVVAVRLPPGAPWVTLDLTDGEVVSVMGIQGSDGLRARAAVRELRALVDDRSAPDRPDPR